MQDVKGDTGLKSVEAMNDKGSEHCVAKFIDTSVDLGNPPTTM